MLTRTCATALLLAVMAPAQAHWTRLYPVTSPSPRLGMTMVFDTVRGHCIAFGGSAAALSDETWTFDGASWQRLFVAGPPARVYHSMAFDEARGVAVLFGGVGQQTLSDTWEWNGASWLQRLPAVAPAGRQSCAMAYDPGRRRTAVFGGAGNQVFGDLWEWDGSNWLQRSGPGPGPTQRVAAAMAHDPTVGGLLMFGGSSSAPLDETWHWSGNNWTRRFPTNPPYARAFHRMVTDTTRRRVTLFGGDVVDPLVWEWDGREWSTRFLMAPAPRSNPALAHHGRLGITVLFGGERVSTALLADTWKFQTDAPASAAPFGTACPGSNGTPTLTVTPYRLPWLGDTLITETANAPATAPVLFATGTELLPPIDLGPLGMPGCTQYSAAQDAALTLASAAGAASHSLPVPEHPALVGVELVQQAAVLDPAANATGATTTAALRLRVGIR